MAELDVSTGKLCRLCKEYKPFAEFTKDRNRADGFYVWCRPCNKLKASEYYRKNPAAVKERVDKWRKFNWIALKPKLLEYRHRRLARQKNAEGSHTHKDVLMILGLQKYRCATCKTSIKRAFHIDHVVPLSMGGSNDRLNIQMLCPTCNLRKSDKDPLRWANENGFLL